MSLIYRGHQAQLSSIVNTVETGVKGLFLGRPFSIRSTQSPLSCDKPYLQYRGVIY